jgi:hypothetical protein
MKISILQKKIADYFDVPVTYFFDDMDTKIQTIGMVFNMIKYILKDRINKES